METNTQYYQMLAGSTCANYLLQMTVAEEIKRAHAKPYIKHVGETFYLGNGDQPVKKKQHKSIISRMFRLTGIMRRICVWKKRTA